MECSFVSSKQSLSGACRVHKWEQRRVHTEVSLEMGTVSLPSASSSNIESSKCILRHGMGKASHWNRASRRTRGVERKRTITYHVSVSDESVTVRPSGGCEAPHSAWQLSPSPPPPIMLCSEIRACSVTKFKW